MPDILALNLRRLGLAKGTTQKEELAHRANIDRNYLGAIERAEHKATVVIVGRLTAALPVLPRGLLELPANHPHLARLSENPWIRNDGGASWISQCRCVFRCSIVGDRQRRIRWVLAKLLSYPVDRPFVRASMASVRIADRA